MTSTNPTSWYLAFTIGAVCIFVVVVVVVVILQRVRRVGGQLAKLSDTLASIARNTGALPEVADINVDTNALNEILAGSREDLQRIARWSSA
jgi:hypothetical protein